MKITIIASDDYFSTYGGGQIYVKNLVHGLNSKGHTIMVVSVSISSETPVVQIKTQETTEALIYQMIVPSVNMDLTLPNELQSSVEIPLKELLSELKPEIVHANGWKYTTSKVCDELSIPCVATAHHGGIVCPNGMLMDQYESICTVPASMKNCLECAMRYVPGGRLWTPIVRILPENTALKFAKTLKKIRNIPYVSPAFITPLSVENKLKQIDVLRKSSVKMIAPSHAIGDALMRNGISAEKITVIPHGITPLEKKPLEEGLSERPLRFGYVGRIAYVKGLHILMDALNLLPDGSMYELHIYGEAVSKSEKRYYQKLQKQSEGLHVYRHGKVSYGDIAKAYHSFDMLVLPSICLEVYGLTVTEALSVGRPVIATRCGGPEDIIKDGIDGILAEPNDPQDLYRAIKKCMDEPEHVKKLASTIRQINTLDSHIEMLEKLYYEMMKG